MSELKIYADNFGLIGTFSEFVSIIYGINRVVNKEIERKRASTQQG